MARSRYAEATLGAIPFRNYTTRRDFIQFGLLAGLAGAGGTLASLRAAEPGAPHSSASSPNRATLFGRAKSCILVWLDGGPSHLDMWDPKPDAPAEVRGPFDPISTSVPGVAVSELLPRMAERLDRVAIVRSMTSPLGEHNFGTHYLLTGYKPTPALEYPTFGGIVSHLRESRGVLPDFIAAPAFRVGGGRLSGHGFLPASAAPFSLDADPGQAGFRVRDLDFHEGLNARRVERRREFLQQADKLRDGDAAFERAFQLTLSAESKGAFRLEDESAKTRQAYGGRSIGACCLLARRLVERDVPFVFVNNAGWDTHDNAYTRLKEGYTGATTPVGLVPSLDQALAALLDDLQQRGKLDETLVLVMGEFGRTPKLNTSGGRDHWPRVFSVLAAGAGISGGQVIGSSDATGENPRERPITPTDLAATIYTLLGIDPAQTLYTSDGRPVLVNPGGEPVRELLGRTG